MVGLGEAPQLANLRIWPKTLILNPHRKECAVYGREKKKAKHASAGKEREYDQGLCRALSVVHPRKPGPGDGSRLRDQELKGQTAWVLILGALPLSRCVTSLP